LFDQEDDETSAIIDGGLIEFLERTQLGQIFHRSSEQTFGFSCAISPSDFDTGNGFSVGGRYARAAVWHHRWNGSLEVKWVTAEVAVLRGRFERGAKAVHGARKETQWV
jgi:hypothetical protein